MQAIQEIVWNVTHVSYVALHIMCFLFLRANGPNWEMELKDDVIEECNKHGGVLHIYVDRASPQGNIYIKCPSLAAAAASVNALHGRIFAGEFCFNNKFDILCG